MATLAEWDLINAGNYPLWAGIDEAGRGAWAGPVVAACVVLDWTTINARPDVFSLVNDSKQLTKKKREALYEKIQEACLDWGLGVATQEEIDATNILRATKLAMCRAWSECTKHTSNLVFIDGNQGAGIRGIQEVTVVKGDSLSCAVACASILAKVWRDRYMAGAPLSNIYGFDKHSGYGTAVHKKALEAHGPSELHRKTFSPIKDML